MREILYKAKRKDNSEWVEGWLFASYNRAYIITLVDDEATWKNNPRLLYSEVDPATVCEFTGMVDKNGKKIFEGDIVYDDFRDIGYVKFSRGAYIFKYIYGNGICNAVCEWCEWEKYEVVGSVFDHPELLGEDKQ